ncbi:MAG: hypothetical protein ABFC65_09300 [Rectinema sp.]
MKKFVVFLIVGLLASSAAWGNDNTQINITANIAQKLDVSVSGDWSIDLDNKGTAYQNDSQGTLTVISNKNSYTVTFSSENGGTLKYGSETIIYKVKVDTDEWTGVVSNALESYKQLTTAQGPYTIVFNQKTPKDGIEFDIGLQIPEYTNLYSEGAYTDTIYISITHS